MTPKEKADELYGKMLLTHSKRKYNGDRAIKGVSLILDEILNDGKMMYCGLGMNDHHYKFWEDVKIELEKMK